MEILKVENKFQFTVGAVFGNYYIPHTNRSLNKINVEGVQYSILKNTYTNAFGEVKDAVKVYDGYSNKVVLCHMIADAAQPGQPGTEERKQFVRWSNKVSQKAIKNVPGLISMRPMYEEKLAALMSKDDVISAYQEIQYEMAQIPAEDVKSMRGAEYRLNRLTRLVQEEAKSKALYHLLNKEPVTVILIVVDSSTPENRSLIRNIVKSGINVRVVCYTYGEVFCKGINLDNLKLECAPRPDGKPHCIKSLPWNQNVQSPKFDTLAQAERARQQFLDYKNRFETPIEYKTNCALYEFYTMIADRKHRNFEYVQTVIEVQEFKHFCRTQLDIWEPVENVISRLTGDNLYMSIAQTWSQAVGYTLHIADDEPTPGSYNPIRGSHSVDKQNPVTDMEPRAVWVDGQQVYGPAPTRTIVRDLNRELYKAPTKHSYAGNADNETFPQFERTESKIRHDQALASCKRKVYSFDSLKELAWKVVSIHFIRDSIKANPELADSLLDSEWTVCPVCCEPHRKTQWGCDNPFCEAEKTHITIFQINLWHGYVHMNAMNRVFHDSLGNRLDHALDGFGRIPAEVFYNLPKDFQRQLIALDRDKVNKKLEQAKTKSRN